MKTTITPTGTIMKNNTATTEQQQSPTHNQTKENR